MDVDTDVYSYSGNQLGGCPAKPRTECLCIVFFFLILFYLFQEISFPNFLLCSTQLAILQLQQVT
jgi:hypothetical protein